MLNLALRSCGFYINSTKHSKNTWGSSFFGESSQSCDSKHDTLFGCTNTTFTDQNGEPEGDVVFVNTNCTSNERLVQGQDPRYYSELHFFFEDIGDRQGVSLNVSVSGFQPFPPEFQTQGPFGDETCFRACLCGYTLSWSGGVDLIPSTSLAPYQVCKCSQILGDYYSTAAVNLADKIPLTSANMTLLRYYGGLPCDAQVGQSGDFTETFYSGFTGSNVPHFDWVWVPDNFSMMVPVGSGQSTPPDSTSGEHLTKNNYECFDNFDNMQSVILNYINQSYGGDFDLEPAGRCN